MSFKKQAAAIVLFSAGVGAFVASAAVIGNFFRRQINTYEVHWEYVGPASHAPNFVFSGDDAPRSEQRSEPRVDDKGNVLIGYSAEKGH